VQYTYTYKQCTEKHIKQYTQKGTYIKVRLHKHKEHTKHATMYTVIKNRTKKYGRIQKNLKEFTIHVYTVWSKSFRTDFLKIEDT
jgi:hypothetical protein